MVVVNADRAGAKGWKTAKDSSGMIGGAVCLRSKRELRQSWTWYPIVMEWKRGMWAWSSTFDGEGAWG